MNGHLPRVFLFREFKFEADGLALYHRGELVKGVDKKSLEVLATLLEDANEIVKYDDIIERVWGDSPHGIGPPRVNQYASKLQKVFAKYEPEGKFIENLKGRGYIFTAEVEREQRHAPQAEIGESFEPAAMAATSGTQTAFSTAKEWARRPFRYAFVLSPLILLVVFVAWAWYPGDEKAEVKRVVKESQLYESLVLYKNPSAFREEDLDRYWTSELDLNTNYDRAKIRQAVAKLVGEGRRYGDESKCEQFDFQSVELNAGGDTAIVKTLEKWFVAVYGPDGQLIKNRNIGPYFVSYVLRKVSGRWLIEKSNTARANPPAPRLASVEATTEAAAGRQFLVRLTGEDFLDELVFVKVVGNGCPEANPCIVPNSALRNRSTIRPTILENVPMTLASGEFTLFAVNGNSADSNPVRLRVP